MPDSTIQPSFIPHDEDLGRGVRVRPSGLITLFMLLSIVLFVASCVLAGGVFLYQQILESDKTAKISSLETAKKRLDPGLLAEWSRLEDRLRAADNVLDHHISPSALLYALEESTIITLGFNSLMFDSTDPTGVSLKMDGVADGVNTVALQADILSKQKMFETPIFSGINREEDGVHFSVTATLDPSSLSYIAFLEKIGSPPPSTGFQQPPGQSIRTTPAFSTPPGGANQPPPTP